MKILLTLVTPFLLVGIVQSQTTRALFLGNSYTYTNDLPTITTALAESAGYNLETEANTPGGYTFQGHTTNATTITMLQEGNWDFVVLQEQSQIPSFPLSQVEEDCFPYAYALDNMINEYNPCAETVFFMTWGRENGDDQNCANWPPVCTYEGMDDLLYERYMMMADDNEAIVSPVGRVWRSLRNNYPEIDLYSADGSHPSAAGSYAAACCFFVSFFRADPNLCTYNYNLDENTAAIIRMTTKALVYDDLAAWHIGTYDLQASFEYTVDQNYTVNFINTTNSDGNFNWWLDVSSSTDVNPTVDYPGPGEYDIILIADNGCEIDTLFSTLILNPVSIHESLRETFTISPNPATESLQFYARESGSWQIIDISGKEKARGNIAAPSRVIIPVSNISPGIYILKFLGQDERFIIR